MYLWGALECTAGRGIFRRGQSSLKHLPIESYCSGLLWGGGAVGGGGDELPRRRETSPEGEFCLRTGVFPPND